MAKTTETNPVGSLTSSQQIQRKAFYTGLTSILTEQQAVDALEEWATYINETGSAFNGLNSFAKEVCKKYDKDDQQRDLVRALNRALFNKNKITIGNEEIKKPVAVEAPETSLEVDQSVLMDQPISTPDFQTFEYLFLRILTLVSSHNREVYLSLPDFLKELTLSMPWSETQQQQMLILIESGATTQLRAYRPDQLKTFMKHLRSWLIGELGKPDAESVWVQAIKQTELNAVNTKYAASNYA